MADSHLLGEEHPNYDEIYGNNPDSNHFSSWLPRQPRQAPFFLQWLPWIIHLLLFSINGSLLTLAWQYRDAAKSHSLQAGSFYEGNQFGTVVQQIGESTDFQGRPSGVNDKYWNSLLYTGMISISAEEKSAFAESTAEDNTFPGRYVVELNVFHQLHCLHMLRHQFYHPQHINMSDTRKSDWEIHMDHCIESLRQTLVCQADLTPQLFIWRPATETYTLTKSATTQCRDFQAIVEWAKSRNFTADSADNFQGIDMG